MLVAFGDGKRVVTSNVNSATVTVIDPRTVTPPGSDVPRVEWLETVIPVDRGPEGIDVSPDGHDAWRSEERRVGKSVELGGGRRSKKKIGDRPREEWLVRI